uniref:Ig-like domain-containing protein n=1 Tax=Amphimedon queenslandica TaxID=400682 RepID=A0A1X7TI32_AMPQE
MFFLKYLLLLLCLLFYSVDSCSTVSRSGVSLTGVCPNDTFTVPIGTTLSYECSYSFSTGYYPFWNVSGTELSGGNFKPPGISDSMFNNGKATITVLTDETIPMYIQCGLRGTGPNINMGLTSRVRFIETEVVTFGPKISDELIVIDDNYTIEFNVTTPCDIALLNNYTYTLLQRDYCQTELNSTQLNISLLDDNVLPNAMIPISVNIESLIHDSTCEREEDTKADASSYRTCTKLTKAATVVPG